jgi:hypothetical protein
MKKSNWLPFLWTGMLTFSLFMPAVADAEAAPAMSEWNTARYGDRIDIDQHLQELSEDESYVEEAEKKLMAQADEAKALAAEAEKPANDFTYDGGTKVFLDLELKAKEFTLRSVGENVEIWVAKDLAYGPNNPKPADVVTQAQVDKLRDEFETNIFPVDTQFFGAPDALDGSSAALPGMLGLPADYYAGSDKVILLIDNIKDAGWNNPAYPFFVAGFFSPMHEKWINRNMLTIDSSSWTERLETTFFGTTIHELQHLIHADNDKAEELWVNEGMSTFSEFLGGYGHNAGSINFFLDHPENSLVNWDEHVTAATGPETVADYGQAYLFMLYLYDKFGSEFIRGLAADGTSQGIAGIEKALQEEGESFDEIYQNFMAALTLDHAAISSDYDIDSIDLRNLPVDAAGGVRGKTVSFESAKKFEKQGVPAWGGDFKEFNFGNDVRGLKFNGEDFLPLQWEATTDPLGGAGKVLHAKNSALADNELVFAADLADETKPALTFKHYYQLEKGFDAAAVQISTDNGDTWTSLANANTATEFVPEAHPNVVGNAPGFTGTNGGWTTETFDLSQYAGEEVLLSFRLLTDWGTQEAGWYVDDIKVGAFANDGMSTQAFKSLGETKSEYVQFLTTFIYTDEAGKESVVHIDPFDVTNKDALNVQEILKAGNVKMITSYAATPGKNNPVDFTYEVLYDDAQGMAEKETAKNSQ